MRDNKEIVREFNLCGCSAIDALAYAVRTAHSLEEDNMFIQRPDVVYTNMFVEKYVEMLDRAFRTFKIITDDINARALDYLSGKDAVKFPELCARLHVEMFDEQDSKEFYTDLAYSALEVVRRRSVG